jgi:hypothetical protein
MQFVAGKNTSLLRDSWAVSKLDICLERLRDEQFAQHVWTDDLSVREVANHIAETAGLELTPNTDGQARAYLRRSWTSLKHIRFD